MEPVQGAMNPGLHGRFRAAENPANLGKAEVLLESESEKSAVSPSKTEERATHLLTLDVSQGSRRRIDDRRFAASMAQRGEETPALVDGQVDRDPHQPRPLIRVIAETVPMLPQTEKRFMTNLLSDVRIEDHEVDGTHDERIDAAIEGLERAAAIVAFGHVISSLDCIYNG